MPRTNLNAQAAEIFKVIELTIDGKDYDIDKMDGYVFEELLASEGNPRAMKEAMAKLVGADKKEFKHTDPRILTLAMFQISKETKEQLDVLVSKNVPGESVKQKV